MYRMANRPQQSDLIMARSIKMELTIFYWLHLQRVVRNTPRQLALDFSSAWPQCLTEFARFKNGKGRPTPTS